MATAAEVGVDGGPHNNGLPKAQPRLVARARITAAYGYAVATIDAAGLFAGGYVPRAQREEAGQVTVPLLMLLRWDSAQDRIGEAWSLADTARALTQVQRSDEAIEWPLSRGFGERLQRTRRSMATASRSR